MKKRGFTTIELLSVIIILAIIMGIAVIGLNYVLDKGNESFYQNVEQELMLSGTDYFNNHRDLKPIDGKQEVEISTLVKDGYIEPITDKDGNICNEGKVYIFTEGDKFNYEACLDNCGGYTSNSELCLYENDSVPPTCTISLSRDWLVIGDGTISYNIRCEDDKHFYDSSVGTSNIKLSNKDTVILGVPRKSSGNDAGTIFNYSGTITGKSAGSTTFTLLEGTVSDGGFNKNAEVVAPQTLTVYKKSTEGTPAEGLIFNGNNQVLISGGSNVTYTCTNCVDGVSSARNAGTYHIVITTNDGSLFTDGKETHEIDVTIGKMTLPIPSQNGSLTYNKESQSPSWNNDSSWITASGITETNAGTYTATFKINEPDNIQWSDGKVEDKKVNWVIGKKSITPSVDSVSAKTYDGSKNATGTIKLSNVISGDTVTASGTCTFADANVGTSKTVTCGSITISGASASNYQLDATSKNGTGTINAKSVAVSWGSTTSWVYDGNTHIPTASATGISGETINLSVVTPQINVGNYTATASCSSVTGGNTKCDNYSLTGTTKDFSITKASCSCSITSIGTMTYPGSTTGTVSYTCTGDGTKSITSSDINSISVSGNTLTAKKLASNITITAKQGEGINYKACSNGTKSVSVGGTSYSLSYTLNSGTQASSGVPSTYTYGTGATINGTPTRSGYTFNGWCTASNLTGCAFSQSINTTTSGTKTYYAKWCQNCASVSNGKCTLTASTAGTCTYATSCNTGYTLTSGDKTYNPTCSVNSYTLTYNANGGSVSSASKSVNYGAGYGTLPTPTRTGYSFAGWFTAASGGTQVATTTIMGVGNTTIYAHWNVNSYTLTLTVGTGIGKIYYKVNGATTYSSTTSSTIVQVNYGSTWYAYAEAGAGYKYSATSSSSPASGTMGTSSVTFAPTGEKACSTDYKWINTKWDTNNSKGFLGVDCIDTWGGISDSYKMPTTGSIGQEYRQCKTYNAKKCGNQTYSNLRICYEELTWIYGCPDDYVGVSDTTSNTCTSNTYAWVVKYTCADGYKGTFTGASNFHTWSDAKKNMDQNCHSAMSSAGNAVCIAHGNNGSGTSCAVRCQG